jgi:hypothetical protein
VPAAAEHWRAIPPCAVCALSDARTEPAPIDAVSMAFPDAPPEFPGLIVVPLGVMPSRLLSRTGTGSPPPVQAGRG